MNENLKTYVWKEKRENQNNKTDGKKKWEVIFLLSAE